MLNAGRLYLDLDDLSGKVFVTSGLGGMSGAQAKVTIFIYPNVSLIFEVNAATKIIVHFKINDFRLPLYVDV